MAEFTGDIVITKKGLSALSSAQLNIPIRFTRFGAGDGELNGKDARDLTALISEKLAYSITSAVKTNDTEIRVRGIMKNEEIRNGFFVREIGLYAENPENPDEEFLYAVMFADIPDYLPAYKGRVVSTITTTVYVGVNDADNITITIQQGAYASALDLQEVWDLINSGSIDGRYNYELDYLFWHGLETYPDVLLIEIGAGFDIRPFDTTPFDAPGSSYKVPCGVTYINSNCLRISTGKNYGPLRKEPDQLSDREYIVSLKSGKALRVILITSGLGNVGYQGAPPPVVAGVRTFNGRPGDIDLLESDLTGLAATVSDVDAVRQDLNQFKDDLRNNAVIEFNI